MDLTDPGPGEAWKLDQFWTCLECGRHFWTTYPENGVCHPPAQWGQAQLPTR